MASPPGQGMPALCGDAVRRNQSVAFHHGMRADAVALGYSAAHRYNPSGGSGKSVMDVLRHLDDIAALLQGGRLMEAESLERALVMALSGSTKPENRVALSLVESHCDTVDEKIRALGEARRYLEARYLPRSRPPA